MVFSSAVFLFYFLPFVLFVVYAVKIFSRKTVLFVNIRNFVLLVVSCIFYAWGESYFVLLLLFLSWVNYKLALKMSCSQKHAWRWLCAGVLFDLTLLIGIKYGAWLHDCLADFGVLLGLIQSYEPATVRALPLGVSFYTFQSLSYVVDVYRKDTLPATKFTDFACYLLMFSQLVAGPIIRYADMNRDLLSDKTSTVRIYNGIKRFVIGLAKKSLVANQMALVADTVFQYGADELNMPLAFIGVLCYALQIYYDFSAYSDMAIGMGEMFGFSFMENFRHPYGAISMRDFWRKWHISLSTWFRDYVYIPLGGNRCPQWRCYFNQIIVFVLCGLWHGANWTFVIWGLWHGLFIALERGPFGLVLGKMPTVLRRIYVWCIFLIGWIIFRCNSLTDAGIYFKAFFGMSSGHNAIPLADVLDAKLVLLMFIALIGSTGVFSVFYYKWEKSCAERGANWSVFFESFIVAYGAICAFFSAVMILGNSYNPFIYFRF